MKFTHLGHGSKYPDKYDNSLIQVVSRTAINNMPKGVFGYDLWWAYEISWLDAQQKPNVAVAEIIVPVTSKFIIESKSLKLYLNSLNMTIFPDPESVIKLITDDLTAAIQTPVIVTFKTSWPEKSSTNYHCLDNLAVECTFDRIDKSLLSTSDNVTEEHLVSHLLKSNCLVTNQPDWGSLFISYQGRKINHKSLLKYIISYRKHNGFHEHCVDQCFADITEICQPKKLTVHAQYTRRGGIDINPIRSSEPLTNFILSRTFRQ